jgi:hypothetical protein
MRGWSVCLGGGRVEGGRGQHRCSAGDLLSGVGYIGLDKAPHKQYAQAKWGRRHEPSRKEATQQVILLQLSRVGYTGLDKASHTGSMHKRGGAGGMKLQLRCKKRVPCSATGRRRKGSKQKVHKEAIGISRKQCRWKEGDSTQPTHCSITPKHPSRPPHEAHPPAAAAALLADALPVKACRHQQKTTLPEWRARRVTACIGACAAVCGKQPT